MLRQKQKIIHVLDELLNYALKDHSRKVIITIEDLDDKVKITLKDEGAPVSEQECQEAQIMLNAPHRNEMADYYGGLAGEESFGTRSLRLARLMVDGGAVETCGPGMRLSVWWQQE